MLHRVPPRASTGLMAAALVQPVWGVMTPPQSDVSRHLLQVRPGAFDDLDLHAEIRLALWGAVAVLSIVLWLAHLVGIH
jgi:hypothetical protein